MKKGLIVIVVLLILALGFVGLRLTGNVVDGVDISRGLVAHYVFGIDEGLSDSSGNGRDVVKVYGPIHREQYGGVGYEFDGVNDYLDLGDGEAFALRDAFTLSAWVQTDEDDPRRVLYRGRGNSIEQMNYQLLVGPGEASVGFGTGLVLRTVEGTFDEDGGGHYVAGTFSSSGQELALYVDGALIGSSRIGEVPALENDARALIGTGDSLWSDGVQPILSFGGTVDDVRMYDRALLPEEVAVVHGTTLAEVEAKKVLKAAVEEVAEEVVEDPEEEFEVEEVSQAPSEVSSEGRGLRADPLVWFLLGVVVAVLIAVVWKRKRVI